jgi:NAD(P)-dependent dehydrogenase (short-subunit alcohol dehydrogenase family)
MPDPREYVLITGSSSGIGDAAARRIACTSPVILHGRDSGRLEALRASLPGNNTHLTWICDLSQTEEIGPSLAAMLAASNARVSALLHCAGEFRISAVTASDPAGVLRQFRTNFFSATAITRALIKKNINGTALRSIVFVSSIASRFGARGYSIYAATKGALDSLSRSLAAELAPIRVNTILPGAIRTPGTEFLYAGGDPSNLGHGYLLGEGRTEDVASMAEFLLSENARWITGQQFIVDGGKTAH